MKMNTRLERLEKRMHTLLRPGMTPEQRQRAIRIVENAIKKGRPPFGTPGVAASQAN
jgi:hypothetical protein